MYIYIYINVDTRSIYRSGKEAYDSSPEIPHIKGKWFTMNAFPSMLCAGWLLSGNYVEFSPKPFVPRAAPSFVWNIISMPFSCIIPVTASMVCWSNSASEQQRAVMIYHSNTPSEGGSTVIHTHKEAGTGVRNTSSCTRASKEIWKPHCSRYVS